MAKVFAYCTYNLAVILHFQLTQNKIGENMRASSMTWLARRSSAALWDNDPNCWLLMQIAVVAGQKPRKGLIIIKGDMMFGIFKRRRRRKRPVSIDANQRVISIHVKLTTMELEEAILAEAEKMALEVDIPMKREAIGERFALKLYDNWTFDKRSRKHFTKRTRERYMKEYVYMDDKIIEEFTTKRGG